MRLGPLLLLILALAGLSCVLELYYVNDRVPAATSWNDGQGCVGGLPPWPEFAKARILNWDNIVNDSWRLRELGNHADWFTVLGRELGKEVVRVSNAFVASEEAYAYNCKYLFFAAGCGSTENIVEKMKKAHFWQPDVYDQVVLLTSMWGGAVFHTLVMEIPRLYHVHQIIESIPDIKIAVAGAHRESVHHYIQLLLPDFDVKRLINYDRGFFAKTLYLPKAPSCGTIGSSEIAMFVNKRFVQTLLSQNQQIHEQQVRERNHEQKVRGRQPIYILLIDRSPGRTRSFSNVDAVHESIGALIDELQKQHPRHQFSLLFFEPLDSFQTMVSKFFFANIVIGPHGAGFSNLIFNRLPSQVFLIEQFPKGYINYCFRNLLMSLGGGGGQYFGHECSVPDNNGFPASIDHIISSTRISVEMLCEQL